jgi:hypothetical protein
MLPSMFYNSLLLPLLLLLHVSRLLFLIGL